MTDEMAEVLYRERFGLSWSQMQNEPAEAMEYWLLIERERRSYEDKQSRKRH